MIMSFSVSSVELRQESGVRCQEMLVSGRRGVAVAVAACLLFTLNININIAQLRSTAR